VHGGLAAVTVSVMLGLAASSAAANPDWKKLGHFDYELYEPAIGTNSSWTNARTVPMPATKSAGSGSGGTDTATDFNAVQGHPTDGTSPSRLLRRLRQADFVAVKQNCVLAT
jgi:hypothetical protein